mmetsp:Transcript_24144/g.55008  ORF Transcript_24144/g.55008 Transcript_24144/m.55008 type:complete len:220 (-) Transcript_24144:289-948(-)
MRDASPLSRCQRSSIASLSVNSAVRSSPISSQTVATQKSAEQRPATKLVQVSSTLLRTGSQHSLNTAVGSAGVSEVSSVPVSSQQQHLRDNRVSALFSRALQALCTIVFQYDACHRLRHVGQRRIGTVKAHASIAPSTQRDRHVTHNAQEQSGAPEPDGGGKRGPSERRTRRGLGREASRLSARVTNTMFTLRRRSVGPFTPELHKRRATPQIPWKERL